MSQPEAVATGELKSTPLGGLLVSINKRQLSGSLVLAETPERLHCICLQQGFPTKARLADSVELIGELLVELKEITGEKLAEILKEAQTSEDLTGKVAIRMGHTSDQGVYKALIFQTLRRISWLFQVQTGTYGFYREDFLAKFGDSDAPQVDPLAILSEGVRARYNENRLATLMKGFEHRTVSLNAPAELIGRFRFNDQELAVIRAMTAPMAPRDLSRRSGQPTQVVYSVLHCLHMTQVLDIGEPLIKPSAPPPAHIKAPQPRPSIPVQKTSSPPPKVSAPPPAPQHPAPSQKISIPNSPTPVISSPSPAPAYSMPKSPTPSSVPKAPAKPPPPQIPKSDGPKSERRIEAEALIEKGEDLNHFELLGIDRNASPADIQKAYVNRAKQFHPDRATGDLAEIRPLIANLFSRISVARQTLTDPEKRKEYMAKIELEESGQIGGDGPANEEEMVRNIIEADESFFKARILLRRNKLDEAEEFVKSALEVNPQQGDYVALAAWIESRKRKPGKNVGDLIRKIQIAVETVPRNEEAHFYLAQLLYQDGRREEALQEYKKVMELNEHNIEAVRMVRILTRKKEQTKKIKTKGKSSGLLGSLFGDKSKKK